MYPKVGHWALRCLTLVSEHLLQDRGLLLRRQPPTRPSRCLLHCKSMLVMQNHLLLIIRHRPGPEIGILLSTYEFANANKVFCSNLVTLQSQKKGDSSPLSAYLSLTSYMFQHAHRSSRSALYTYLSLFVLQILVEDQLLVKRLCSDENKLTVRLCRQRQPYLPLVRGERVPAAIIIDLMVDGINHNLRRRLDVDLYK